MVQSLFEISLSQGAAVLPALSSVALDLSRPLLKVCVILFIRQPAATELIYMQLNFSADEKVLIKEFFSQEARKCIVTYHSLAALVLSLLTALVHGFVFTYLGVYNWDAPDNSFTINCGNSSLTSNAGNSHYLKNLIIG